MGWCGFGLREKQQKENEVEALMKNWCHRLWSLPQRLTQILLLRRRRNLFSGSCAQRLFQRPRLGAAYLSVNAEFEAYLSDLSVPPKNPAGTEWNPLDYWRINAHKFKRLSVLAREILSATATTAGVERVFSLAGILLSDRRLRTGDVNFETLLFCNVNKSLIPITKKRKILEKWLIQFDHWFLHKLRIRWKFYGYGNIRDWGFGRFYGTGNYGFLILYGVRAGVWGFHHGPSLIYR